MKDKPTPNDESKSPQDRFKDLATRILQTPKKEVERRDKEWQKERKRRRKT